MFMLAFSCSINTLSSSILEGNWIISNVSTNTSVTSSQKTAIAALAMLNSLPAKASITTDAITLFNAQDEVIETVKYFVPVREGNSDRIYIMKEGEELDCTYKVTGNKMLLTVEGVIYEMRK